MPRKKIPTKAELIQLQKLYKTDEKIAERLGNATPQLVAYWRRKKNIPRHSFPKFSEAEIRELWERYGDDYRCGLELGISKAAFYNWRRKYGLKQKPAFLKLEQLELDLVGPDQAPGKRHNFGRHTISQKILAERAGLQRVDIGQEVEVEPDLALTRQGIDAVLKGFLESGHSYVWNPNRIVISLDQCPVFTSEDVADIHRSVREFVKKQNIKNFYDVHEGTCHQLIIENGLALPGQLAVGSDPQVTSYGCVGTMGTPIGSDVMTSLWETGRVSIRVPETVKIIVNGRMPRGVYAKDVCIFIAGKLGSEAVKGRAVEFYGTTVSQMSISERFTLTNVAAGLGALTAICSFDTTTRRYFSGRARMPFRPALADKDAVYCSRYEFNINHIVAQAALPHSIDNTASVTDIAGLPIDQIIVGSSTNGRLDDLRVAADIIKGKRVDPNVRLLVIPGSRAIYLDALKKGLIRAFVESGAVVLNPGCAPCVGSHRGTLGPGERCLATTGDNSRGSMGSSDAEVYLVSPATAAASALKGVITDPTGYVK